MMEDYIAAYSQPQDRVLAWIEKQTHLRTNHARMLCGPVEGKLLEMISGMISPRRILEIGVFTGYSSICLARGLKEGGMLDALELNDELEDLIREAYRRAELEDRIRLYIGDAKEIIPGLDPEAYDLVFIDANKREYTRYYDLIWDKVRPGGYIIADNVLWNGKVLSEHAPADAQTRGIMEFNERVRNDPRVENVILPLRDGLNLIRKKFPSE